MALSEEQLKARSSGLGGTDMVAICGETPYRSAIDVWLEKRHGMGLEIPVGPPEPWDGNERTEWGTVLEPVLADRYAADTGLTLLEPHTTYRHPDRPWQIGTVDRLCYEDDPDIRPDAMKVLDACDSSGALLPINMPFKIWEGKSHGLFGGKAYDLKNMVVPDDKRIQAAWYMSLTGCKQCDLSALFDTHLYRVFKIPHDQEIEDYMLEEAENFWGKIVEGVHPDPDGSKGFEDYLKKRFKLHSADMVECPENRYGDIISYKQCRTARNIAEEGMDLAKSRICEAIGSDAGFTGTNGKTVVTWKRRTVGATSWKKVAEALRYDLGMTDDEFETLRLEHTGDAPRVFNIK